MPGLFFNRGLRAKDQLKDIESVVFEVQVIFDNFKTRLSPLAIRWALGPKAWIKVPENDVTYSVKNLIDLSISAMFYYHSLFNRQTRTNKADSQQKQQDLPEG